MGSLGAGFRVARGGFELAARIGLELGDVDLRGTQGSGSDAAGIMVPIHDAIAGTL